MNIDYTGIRFGGHPPTTREKPVFVTVLEN